MDSRGTRAAVWTHYGTLLVGAVILMVLASTQWFYYDEWDIIWQPEGLNRIIAGHNGHWSTVPIAVWMLLQNVFGLSSYLPFMVPVIAAHLVLAHLIWRVMRRVGVDSWIATASTTVFILLGSGAENLGWAFQFGFVGAVTLAVGALLIAMRPTLGARGVVAIVVLLVLGVATAGTAIPFFIPVGLVLLARHGWRLALIGLGIPAVVYLGWLVLLAGPNPASIYRPSGLGTALTGIPEYLARMLVSSWDGATPVRGFGIVVMTALVIAAIVALGRRPIPWQTVTMLGLLAAAVAFAGLTAFSRLGTGIETAGSSRYVYVVLLATLPAVAYLLTLLVRDRLPRLLAVLALIAVVLSHNVGQLSGVSNSGAKIDQHVHGLVSAGLDLADEYPGEIDGDSRPDPFLVPRTLEQLEQLEAEFGLTRISYDDAVRLSALTNVGLSFDAGSSSGLSCDLPLVEGSELQVDDDGVVIRADADGKMIVHAESGTVIGDARTLTVEQGVTRLTGIESLTLVVESTTADVELCSASG